MSYWKNGAAVVVIAAILVIVVDVVGYLIGQRVGATNVPIAVFFVSAVALFAFSFPLLRSYLDEYILNTKLSSGDFAKLISGMNLAEDSPLGAKGTYRFTLAVVVALILATGMYLLVTTSDLSSTATNLLQTIVTTLTGAFASIIAFYYGSRAAEGGAKTMADALQAGTNAISKRPLTVEGLLTTLKKLCSLERVGDPDTDPDLKSIIKDLATEYTKMTAPDRIAFRERCPKEEICKDKPKILELFKKEIRDLTATSTPKSEAQSNSSVKPP